MIKINNSKLAKRLNIGVLSIFPFLFIKDGTNSLLTNETCKIYKLQATDIIGGGYALNILLFFLLAAFEAVSWWTTLLIVLPLIYQPLWIAIEWIIKRKLSEVSLVKQAIELGNEYQLSCETKTHYASFSWFKYI